MTPIEQAKRECAEALAKLDATLADLRDADVEAMITRPAPLLKPTCDEAGNWRYVPAVEIDGPRVPAHRAEAARAERFLTSVAEHNATASPERRIATPDDVARAAVEGVAA